MARYIDADKAMEEINRIGGHNLCEWETLGVKALIDRQPTADVVPKSEVERLERQLEPFKEVQCFTCKHYDIGHDHVPCCYCEDYNKYIWLSADADTEVTTSTCEETRQKVAMEIFEEIEKRSSMWGGERHINYKRFAELKKKYTEEQNNVSKEV